MILVGQALGLRRPRRPPCAGPRKILRRGGESRTDGIVLNVSLDATEFFTIANQMIVAFILPERFTGTPQQQVSSLCGGGLQ